MRSKRAFYVLLGVTIAMVAAAVLTQRPSNAPGPSYGLHTPGLASRVDAVRSVLIRAADMSLHLDRTEDGWVARGKTGFPADGERVRQLVLGISGLQRVDKKTGDPERFHRLELRDVDTAGSKAVRVTLLSGDEVALADILVGKTQDFQQAGRSRYFVRDAGNSQSWLVEGSLPPVLDEPGHWLQQALLPGVAEAGLRSVTVTHADGDSVTVRREPGGEADFRLMGLSDGEEAAGQHRLDAIARTFRRMSLEDVHSADAALDEEIAVVEALTFNGVHIVARIGAADPDYQVRLSATYEPDHDRSGAQDDDAMPDGEQLAGDLSDRWRGRSFVVSQYALDALLVRRADLVGSPEEAAATE